MKNQWSFFFTVTVALFATVDGRAQEQGGEPPALSTLACDPAPDIISPTLYLRALSLDIRGILPTADEVNQVISANEVPESLIDDWLNSEAFATQAVRFHRKLVWNNVGNVNLVNANYRFTRSPDQLLWRRNPATVYRGESVPCRNEPAAFGRDGRILTDGNGLEGYVEVIPYWSNERTPAKVCAFDAQDVMSSETGTQCGTRAAANDMGCGCGPSLRWCSIGSESQRITRSMGEALDRFMLWIFREDRPYSELFTSRKAFVNGPISYFWRHQVGTPAGLVYEPAPLNMSALPAIPFTADDVWQEIELPESHAGVLTRMAYLLRFQTNRARANRFYDAFLCQPFNPPEGGLPVADAESARNPDLQHRSGCKYCHSLLEPAASHWGRWTEQGIGFLDPDGFPPTRSDCEACARRGQACSNECRNFYATQSYAAAEDEFLGMLNAYKFRRADHIRNIEVGPKLLAMSAIADNRLPLCIARRTAEWLLGGQVSPQNDADWIAEIARQFVFSDLSYRALVKSIVTSPRYRRVR
jgi:hypothetical protein